MECVSKKYTSSACKKVTGELRLFSSSIASAKRLNSEHTICGSAQYSFSSSHKVW